ncbi:MAG: hypothetical protein ABEI27_11825 [Halobellus sp.]|uniref:DUF7115 domain-containing protein n=1 Tax=Halobellus sp. TaxID=1979212 RepID=UPI0035D47C05
MSQPEIVQNDLADEDVAARVDLGGEDELYVTPTRTLLYRAEGLLSDESVEEYPHGAERITVSEGRRKAKVTLDYGLDGEETISLPAKRLDRALPPIVEGVLHANDILDEDEQLERLFRFSELTIVIAGRRVVRHIGANLWDEDFETYHYEDVSDLTFEDGSVATSVVLTVNGRQERFKAPKEDARAVRAALETTLLSYWDVDSVAELRTVVESEDDEETDADPPEADNVSFGDGPDPLMADPTEPEELPENATRQREATEAERGERSSVDTANTSAAAESADQIGQQVEASTADRSDATADPPLGESPSSDTDASAAESASESQSSTGGESWAESAEPQSASDVGDGQSPATEQGSAPSGRPEESTSSADEFSFEGSGFESAAPAVDEQVREELSELRAVVEQQNEELRAQRELVEQLIEELRRGR